MLNPRFLRVGSLPPSVKILYVRRTFRKPGGVKTVLLFLVINRASPKRAADGAALAFAAGNPPPATVDPGSSQEDFGDLLIRSFGGLAQPPKEYFSELERVRELQARAAVNADEATTPKQVRQVRQVISDLFDGHVPRGSEIESVSNENGKTEPGLDTGHYDDGHAFGWKAPSKKAVVNLVGSLAFGPPQDSTFKVEITIKSDINNDGKIGPPPPRQQLYKFSFGALGLTFDNTVPVQGGQPEVEHWSVQIQGGTACGTSVATAAFELPWTLSVNGGSPQQRTAQESFVVNPFRFYSFTDNSNNSALAMNLRLVTGSAPSVRVEETHSGSGISNVSVNPQQAAVSATPVSSSC